MAQISLTFPDNSVREFDAGVSTLAVAKSIASSLAKKAVAGELNGTMVDIEQPLNQDGNFKIFTTDDVEGVTSFTEYGCFCFRCCN
jgi:threonyl-tRNA synthetase